MSLITTYSAGTRRVCTLQLYNGDTVPRQHFSLDSIEHDVLCRRASCVYLSIYPLCLVMVGAARCINSVLRVFGPYVRTASVKARERENWRVERRALQNFCSTFCTHFAKFI